MQLNPGLAQTHFSLFERGLEACASDQQWFAFWFLKTREGFDLDTEL
jgi:hypothetical protein